MFCAGEGRRAAVTFHSAPRAVGHGPAKDPNRECDSRSLCAEFGVIAGKGATGLGDIQAIIRDDTDTRLPVVARFALKPLLGQLEHLSRTIAGFDREIIIRSRSDETCRRLQTIPGIGPITASALVATIGDPGRFNTGRNLAAWMGLTPRANATGGKDRGGPISKQGDRYLRRLFVQGAAAVVRTASNPRAKNVTPWLRQMLTRKKPEGRDRGASQQNGQNCLGRARQRRTVPGQLHRSGGVNEPVVDMALRLDNADALPTCPQPQHQAGSTLEKRNSNSLQG